ncbi:hypothetical protein PN447_11825, partial [Anabaena sp. CS-542/02]|nr:hypothetical protein [Anabaena sp. CS-542/02]
VPVTHILFQLLALEPVDSIVFLETPGQTTHTVEIQRSELQNILQNQMQFNCGTLTFPTARSLGIPMNLPALTASIFTVCPRAASSLIRTT